MSTPCTARWPRSRYEDRRRGMRDGVIGHGRRLCVRIRHLPTSAERGNHSLEPNRRTDRTERDADPNAPGGACVDHVCNYLLLGSDSRANLTPAQQQQFGSDQVIGGENRSDTIMLVHSDPALQKVAILSFPRDLWVEIPGHGFDKINAAFEGGVNGGGPLLVAKTLTKLTGLRINHFLYVDLGGFQGIVDTLGGVQMCIPSDLYDINAGLDLKAGCQTLNGYQALAYVRTRHLPCDTIPDFARISRQQQFLRALINRMLQPSELIKVGGLIRPILRNMTRDDGLSPADLVFLVGQLKGITTGAAEFRAVPGTVGWEGSLSVVQMEPAAEKLFAALRNGSALPEVGAELAQTPPCEANITVPVVDHGRRGRRRRADPLREWLRRGARGGALRTVRRARDGIGDRVYGSEPGCGAGGREVLPQPAPGPGQGSRGRTGRRLRDADLSAGAGRRQGRTVGERLRRPERVSPESAPALACERP